MPLLVPGTINHNFLLSSPWYRQVGTEIVLPNDTDGPLQTLFGGHDGLTMVSLKKRFIISGDYGIVRTHNYSVVPTQAAWHASGSDNTRFGNARLGRQYEMCNAQLWQGGRASTIVWFGIIWDAVAVFTEWTFVLVLMSTANAIWTRNDGINANARVTLKAAAVVVLSCEILG